MKTSHERWLLAEAELGEYFEQAKEVQEAFYSPTRYELSQEAATWLDSCTHYPPHSFKNLWAKRVKDILSNKPEFSEEGGDV